MTPTQTMHYYNIIIGEIPQNQHTFALLLHCLIAGPCSNETPFFQFDV